MREIGCHPAIILNYKYLQINITSDCLVVANIFTVKMSKLRKLKVNKERAMNKLKKAL